MANPDPILEIFGQAKKLAQEYRRLTGKPLGITGEVAEYEAARILGVKLSPARQAGYDAVETRDGAVRLLQIKGRCLLDNSKRSQRLGSIVIEKEWDAVLMVLLDQNFDAVEIYEADRTAVVAALAAPGSRAWNERGSMAISKFKSIGRLRWPLPGVGDAMANIESIFSDSFSNWKIRLPHDAVQQRKSGRIVQAGWEISYLFGSDEKGDYLDYYAAHRMTNDRQVRIHADGSCEDLPAISEGRVCSKDPEEDARLQAEYRAENHRVFRMLEKKGFGP